jgi:RimJ/RimL family protein N-acetyltransferase
VERVGTPLPLPDSFEEGGLVLRPPTAEDVDRITQICQDPDIQRFTRVPVPYDRQDAESFVSMATGALQHGRGAHLLVEVDGTVVGCVGATIDPTDQLAVVGYWTAPEARRRGIATTALRRLCRWLLEDVEMARLELETAATNPGSNAVAERLGFRLEGARRSAMLLSAVDGRPAARVDANGWGLLPGELHGGEWSR